MSSGDTAASTASKSHRDLLVFDQWITEQTRTWKIADHPYNIVGRRRGFEVRVYHDLEWHEPYFVTIIELRTAG
jgi:hypothetical protein